MTLDNNLCVVRRVPVDTWSDEIENDVREIRDGSPSYDGRTTKNHSGRCTEITRFIAR